LNSKIGKSLTGFNPLSKGQEDLFLYLKEKSYVYCIDEPSLKLQGDLQTVKGRVLELQFRFCDRTQKENKCKSKEETDKFVKGTNLFMYRNKNSLVNKGFGKKTFKRDVIFDHNPIVSNKPTFYVYQLHVTDVITADN